MGESSKKEDILIGDEGGIAVEIAGEKSVAFDFVFPDFKSNKQAREFAKGMMGVGKKLWRYCHVTIRNSQKKKYNFWDYFWMNYPNILWLWGKLTRKR